MPEVALFPGTQKKNWRRAPGIHCSCMSGSPGFSEELGNYCDTSPCCMTIHYWFTGVNTSTCSLVRSTKPSRVPSVRLESQEWHWRPNNWWQYSTSIQQGRVCMATDRYGKHTCINLPFVFMPCIHFGKAEVAYHHRGLASYVFTWCSCTLQSYILPNISPCYYLQVQVTYINELYRECSGTARTCANNGYQVLLSGFSSAWERG